MNRIKIPECTQMLLKERKKDFPTNGDSDNSVYDEYPKENCDILYTQNKTQVLSIDIDDLNRKMKAFNIRFIEDVLVV